MSTKPYKREAIVHLNFRAGSTIPVPVCTVPSSMDRTSRCNKVDAVRLYASYRMHLLLLKGQRCVDIVLKDFSLILFLQAWFFKIFVLGPCGVSKVTNFGFGNSIQDVRMHFPLIPHPPPSPKGWWTLLTLLLSDWLFACMQKIER